MAEKFDLIVVGAGPTGLMAAKVAGGECIITGECSEARKGGDATRRGISLDKTELLRGLLEEAKKNDVVVIPGTFIHEVEKKGATVIVRGGGKEFEGVFVIASDGLNSKINRRLGFNKERETKRV